MAYCTTTDVANMVGKYRDQIQGFAGQATTITTAQVDVLIDDASDRVRAMIQPRYSVETIESYSQVPPLINMAAKTQAAIYFYERLMSKNMAEDADIINKLKMSLGQIERNINSGLVQDALGNYVPTDLNVLVSLGQTDARITEVFSGSRY
jgi:hypothetical protein